MNIVFRMVDTQYNDYDNNMSKFNNGNKKQQHLRQQQMHLICNVPLLCSGNLRTEKFVMEKKLDHAYTL